jgi:hypothetical protein
MRCPRTLPNPPSQASGPTPRIPTPRIPTPRIPTPRAIPPPPPLPPQTPLPPPQASGPLEQRLEDLHHQRTWLDVFPLLALARPFDMARFWNHAIQVGGRFLGSGL